MNTAPSDDSQINRLRAVTRLRLIIFREIEDVIYRHLSEDWIENTGAALNGLHPKLLEWFREAQSAELTAVIDKRKAGG